MKLRALAVLIFCLGLFCLSQQPRAYWQSRDSNFNIAISGGGGSYTGPIDINGTAYAFWSTRCGSTSYTGNVIDIWDHATGNTTETLVTCSSGGILNTGSPTAIATTCAVACDAKIIYDQSGGGKCSGPCDATQATLANRAAISLSCQNGKMCVQCTNTGSTGYYTPTVTAQAQPYMINWVANRTARFTSTSGTIGEADFVNNNEWGFNTSANVAFHFTGSSIQTATAADANSSVQNLMNGASSKFYINGSQTADGATPGANGIDAGHISLCGISTGATSAVSFLTGNWYETGIWASDKSGNFATYDNGTGGARTYWNF